MTRRMLIDATHAEETRVAVADGTRLVDFDYESQVRKQLKGSIFLAKVTRVEPSLQAAFVNFGGNRHGFLPFSEIHPDYFRIPIADREALLAEQQREMEQRLAEEEEEDRAAAEAAGEEAGDIHEAEDEDDDEDDVEEVGEGALSADSGAEADDDSGASAAEESEEPEEEAQDSGHDDGDHEDSEDEVEAIGNRREDEDFAEDDAIGNMVEEPESDADGNSRREGRGRRGRSRRGRGGGRNRSGGRMPAQGRRVEVLGGDGIEGDQPMRPSLRRNYKIQEVIKRGQIMLVQVSKEERGNKGAAVSTYLSLPGRYCVLMPNSPRAGGVSRKIANYKERKRMREILNEFEVPQGMSVIMRTAGVARTKVEIKRDLDYLMKLWDNIRETTLSSTAPALVHEEGNLVRRSIRDIYSRDIDEIVVSGEDGYKLARDFMKMMIPSHVKRVKQYGEEKLPLFNRYQVESQISAIGDPVVTLPSGGYLVINPTEALVSIDVNSGKATKERHIEETALRTNLEAAEEVARQLKLRDLGGLVVVDFIDMEDRRNNRRVEARMKDALSGDRARIQMGRISTFGLMELSRQRLNPSLTEAQFEKCPHCQGIGFVKTTDAAAINALRALEEEGIRGRSTAVALHVSNQVALYLLNNKRHRLAEIESRYGFTVTVNVASQLPSAGFIVESVRSPDARQQDEDGEDGEEAPRESRSRPRQQQPRSGNEQPQQQPQGERQEGRRRRGRRGGRRRGGSGRFSENEGGQQDSSDGPSSFSARAERDEEHRESRAGRSETRGDDAGFREERGARDDHAQPQDAAPVIAAAEAVAVSYSNDSEPVPSRDPGEYEVVNEAPAQKKRGWWNRFKDE